MRSLKTILRISNINELKEGDYYIVYEKNEKKLLFKFKSFKDYLVYDSLCWCYNENTFNNSDRATFLFDGSVVVKKAKLNDLNVLIF